MDIDVVIINELSEGTADKLLNEEEKTEQTITGISKYLDKDVNLIKRRLCFSDNV